MKKAFFVFLALSLVFCALPLSAHGDSTPAYTVDAVNCALDDTVSVNIYVTNNPGIVSLRLDIYYDGDVLSLEGVENKALLNGYSVPSPDTASPYRLRWADALASTDNTSNGILAAVSFKAVGVGASEIRIAHVEARTVNGAKVTFADATSTATVAEAASSDKVYADGVLTDVDAAIGGFGNGIVSVLAIPSGIDISAKSVTAPANGELVINTGAVYDRSKVTGASGAIISDANAKTIYGWKASSSSWVQRNPLVSIASASCVYDAAQSAISTTSAIGGNIVSAKITGIGVIFIPKAALAVSAGGLGDLDGDGDRTNADLTEAYLTNEYAACGSMAVSIGASGTSYFSATLLTTAPNTTIVCGWYALYRVADAVTDSYFFPSNASASNVKPIDFA